MNSIFEKTKSLFQLPTDTVYLNGNSLGPLPKNLPAHINNLLFDKWGKLLTAGWNQDNWITQPIDVGNKIAKLLGVKTGQVAVGDTLSIKLYQALFSAIKSNSNRKIILSDSSNFPSDLYIADGLVKTLDKAHVINLVEPKDVYDAINDQVAVVYLSHVDYKTSRKHDITKLSAKAKRCGARTVWDLAHSVGVIDLKLSESNVDFAVGCTYKYLNGGPGSPGFIYVSPHLIDHVEPTLQGWMGHRAQFSFEPNYNPANGINKMLVGTQSVIAMASLNFALNIFDLVEMHLVRKRSIELTDLLIESLKPLCPPLNLVSPQIACCRGSHVAYSFTNAYELTQALISYGVMGDFRAPNLIRFGINPLYLDEADITKAAKIIKSTIQNRKWDLSKYKTRYYVT